MTLLVVEVEAGVDVLPQDVAELFQEFLASVQSSGEGIHVEGAALRARVVAVQVGERPGL